MSVTATVRGVASSLLDRQALLSSVFAVVVFAFLLFQVRTPLEHLGVSHSEIVGIARIGDAQRALAATARAELAAVGRPTGPASAALARNARATAESIVATSDASKLTYDGDVDGINFGDLFAAQLPQAIDRATLAATIAAKPLADLRFRDRLEIARLAGQVENVWLVANNDFTLGAAATEIPLERLTVARDAASKTFAKLGRRLDAIGGAPSDANTGSVRVEAADFVAAAATYASALEDALREIVTRRIARERRAVALAVVLCALTLGLGTLAELSRRKTASLAARLRFDAAHDPLTGLHSRAAFATEVSRANETSRTLMLIDLDRFKAVNDTFGHAMGDDVLVEVAARLRRIARADDVISRLHGDEFALAIATGDRMQIARFAERVQCTLREPMSIRGREISIDSSIGTCPIRGGRSAEVALHDADVAMYRAKRSGRGCHAFFEDDDPDLASAPSGAALEHEPSRF